MIEKMEMNAKWSFVINTRFGTNTSLTKLNKRTSCSTTPIVEQYMVWMRTKCTSNNDPIKHAQIPNFIWIYVLFFCCLLALPPTPTLSYLGSNWYYRSTLGIIARRTFKSLHQCLGNLSLYRRFRRRYYLRCYCDYAWYYHQYRLAYH